MDVNSNALTRTWNNLEHQYEPSKNNTSNGSLTEERPVVSTYKENRRDNLIALEKRFGSLEALSDHVGVSASYLSQMKKLRHMGDKVARRFEKRLNLPAGSMDWPAGATATAGTKVEGATTIKMPAYNPDQNVQEFLKDFFDLPKGLRIHLFRRMKQFKAYSDKLTPFQREHFPEPPDSDEGWLQWRNQLEAEIEASVKISSKPASSNSKRKEDAKT